MGLFGKKEETKRTIEIGEKTLVANCKPEDIGVAIMAIHEEASKGVFKDVNGVKEGWITEQEMATVSVVANIIGQGNLDLTRRLTDSLATTVTIAKLKAGKIDKKDMVKVLFGML